MKKSNLLRFLNNVRENPETNRVFQSIDKSFARFCLGSNTPIPNHTFSPAENYEGKPATLYFTENSHKTLEEIRKLMQVHDSSRDSVGRTPKSIEFIALGYMDFDNNYIITDIKCPLLQDVVKAKDPYTLLFKSHSKEYDDGILDIYYTYLNKSFDRQIVKAPIALLGFTKPPVYEENFNTQNCFKLSELSQATYPNEPVDMPIITGVLGITPYLIERVATKNKSKVAYQKVDGSLECAIIDYTINPKTSCPKPNNVYNITKSAIIHSFESSKTTPIVISKSRQPQDGLYFADNERSM